MQLDQEGRCLYTDHGAFVIFNVYIPTNGPACAKLPFKMRMLNRLRECMAAQRARGKAVVLVGALKQGTTPHHTTPWNQYMPCHAIP
jgi:exonuclease III